MQIAIRSSHLNLQPEQRQQIQRRASFALARLSAVIRRVEVSLADTNGPRGRVDKRCRVLVHLDGGAAAFVEDHDSDLATLIDRAMDRAGRAAHKRVDLLAAPSRRIARPQRLQLASSESF
ncbi:MAG: HPF/RaiA family ribosome-associated protein [Burkholderiales bacterium]|nr:HPF/RaiA family ribosome-associated protein [Burkholderiales bacterium]